MTRRLAVVLASCVLAVSACTGGFTTTSTTSAPYTEADVVAWSDQVCGVVGTIAQTTSSEPPLDLTDPDQLKAGLAAWLDGNIATADRSLGELTALQNGPHPQSKAVVAAAEKVLGQVKALLTDTRTQIGATSDPTQIVTAVVGLMTKAGELEPAGVGVQRKFTESGLLGEWQRAQNCRNLAPADFVDSPR